jgi:hypothetical protein
LNLRSFIPVGIVAPIIVGVVLLNIEYSFFTTTKGSLAKEAENVKNRSVPLFALHLVIGNVLCWQGVSSLWRIRYCRAFRDHQTARSLTVSRRR